MKTTDNRLTRKDKDLLASLIGLELEAFTSDKIDPVRPMSYGIVALHAAGQTYALKADIVAGEPYGEPEDVTQLSFRKASPESICPVAIGTPQVKYPVNRLINDIEIYETTVDRFADGNIVSRYISTPAIVFKLAGTELVFENQGWLDEVIDIYRGPGASREIRATNSAIEDEDPEEFKVSRKIISLSAK